jgi:hypothetical protein
LLFLFIALCPAGWLAYKRFGSLKEVAVVSALLIVLFFPAATAGQWLGGELRAFTLPASWALNTLVSVFSLPSLVFQFSWEPQWLSYSLGSLLKKFAKQFLPSFQ